MSQASVLRSSKRLGTAEKVSALKSSPNPSQFVGVLRTIRDPSPGTFCSHSFVFVLFIFLLPLNAISLFSSSLLSSVFLVHVHCSHLLEVFNLLLNRCRDYSDGSLASLVIQNMLRLNVKVCFCLSISCRVSLSTC
jgi:hypothetical protein